MLLPFLVFLIVTGVVVGGWAAVTYLPGRLAERRLDDRLREVSQERPEPGPRPDASVLMKAAEGPLPAVDRALVGTQVGSHLGRLIEQAGMRLTPSAVIGMSLIGALAAAVIATAVIRVPFVGPVAALIGGAAPFLWLKHRRTARLKRFEEQFPDALDLLSRAIRAGHAFQTSLGMAADEMPAPVGPEFKRAFDQQNFGLPLKDALNELAERVPILDVRFFVTAVVIQRETGGNLSEILDNLSHVVRERFKILRQVRVHTAHGRFTGWVLLALPATLAVVLSLINPDHMALLFRERLGQMMVAAAIVMQTIGYVWIRHVIKIEV
jgi:tight adherence protein B